MYSRRAGRPALLGEYARGPVPALALAVRAHAKDAMAKEHAAHQVAIAPQRGHSRATSHS